MKMKTQILTTALTLSLAACSMGRSAGKRRRSLGKDLTPMGAEKAGSKGVSEWTGKAIDGSSLLLVTEAIA